jgi:aryl-alcohol dehydrogenase-like predicted oxidoreductase
MLSRRGLLTTVLATAGLTWATHHRPTRAVEVLAAASSTAAMATRTIPSSGEQVPVIGMGTSGSFEVGSSAGARDPLREVLMRFFAGGGMLIDTAPSYGTAEEVLGTLLSEAGSRSRAFIATKLSSRGRDAGLRQFHESLRRLQTDKVELLQVHNLLDWKAQFALIEELKAQGKVRYSGVTHYLDSSHDELADVVQKVRPDFLQVNYSVVSQNAEKRLFPLARDQGVAVLINRAFDDGNLFSRVRDKALPPWAGEAGITSWAQAFLKFALSHPAVTAVIPATGKPDRQRDNLKAGAGPTLDAAQRRALVALFA